MLAGEKIGRIAVVEREEVHGVEYFGSILGIHVDLSLPQRELGTDAFEDLDILLPCKKLKTRASELLYIPFSGHFMLLLLSKTKLSSSGRRPACDIISSRMRR